MTASSSALAKVCCMLKSDMDMFILDKGITPVIKTFYSKESERDITYKAYDTYTVIKAVRKANKKKKPKKAKHKAMPNKPQSIEQEFGGANDNIPF